MDVLASIELPLPDRSPCRLLEDHTPSTMLTQNQDKKFNLGFIKSQNPGILDVLCINGSFLQSYERI